MLGRFATVSAIGLAAITLPQSCGQVDLSHPGDAVFALAIDDAFGFKSGLRADDPPPPPPDPPDPGGGGQPPPKGSE